MFLASSKNAESESTLQSMKCEGTNNNTDKKNGIVRKSEESLMRPLQWLVNRPIRFLKVHPEIPQSQFLLLPPRVNTPEIN